MPLAEGETNISIRVSKRFGAWFRHRAAQENFKAAPLGLAIIQDWIDRRSPFLNPNLRGEPLQWDPAINWENLPEKNTSSAEPRPAPVPASRRR